MNARLEKPLTKDDLGKRVTKIKHNKSEKNMEVKVFGEEASRKYMTVFATPTLACLQRIDLTELELLYEQKDAIRSLHYDTASKVGMKFKEPWWIDLGIEGGLGKTDMPLRTWYVPAMAVLVKGSADRFSVYPSYNLDDHKDPEEKDRSAVLLCSYSVSMVYDLF